MSESKPFPLPVAGVDQLSEETSLLKGSVRSAVNVDIGRAGRFGRRVGYERKLSGSNYHSVWSAPQRGWVFVAQDKGLYRFDPDTTAISAIAGLNSSDPLSYCEYNGNVYISGYSTLLWLPSNASTVRNVGVPTPPVVPALSATVGGLEPGSYGVTITLVDERGEEGGACAIQTITLPNGGGIQLDGLPIVSGARVFIYLTATNGETLRLAATPPAVFGSYSVAEIPNGAECDTHGLIPMPPGDFVRWHAGRLYTAKNGALSFSQAMRPHLHDPAHGVIPFSGHIAFIEAVTDGLYVGDSRGVWFLAGMDPNEFKLQLISTCRAVRGSSTMVPPEHFPEKKVTSNNPVALWLSTSGYVVGMEGGNTVELQPDRVKVPPGLKGRTAFLLRDGMKQVLTPVNSSTVAVLGTAVDSEIS